MKTKPAFTFLCLVGLLWTGEVGAEPTAGVSDKAPRRPRLAVQELKDQQLTDKDLAKYDAALAKLEKRPPAAASLSEEVATALRSLQQGNVELEFKQYRRALDTFSEAWSKLLTAWRAQPKQVPGQLGQLKDHFSALAAALKDDPAVALAMLNTLDQPYAEGAALAGKAKRDSVYAAPLAELWSALTRDYELERASLEQALFWIGPAPQHALIDRPLDREQKQEYAAALGGVEAAFEQLRERVRPGEVSMGTGGGLPDASGPPMGGLAPPDDGPDQGRGRRGAAGRLGQGRHPPRQRDARAERARGNPPPDLGQRTQQWVVGLPYKREPLMAFLEAQAHARFGQEKRALAASRQGWAGLLRCYHQEPTVAADYDDDTHLEMLDVLQKYDPVRALIFVEQLDDLYRQVASGYPPVAFEIADRWLALSDQLPLPAASLEKAIKWVDTANRAKGRNDSIYTPKLAKLKQELAALKKEPAADKSVPPTTKPAPAGNRTEGIKNH